MDVSLPQHVVRAALMVTGQTSLKEAILDLLGADEKVCANERCGQMFVLQEGHAGQQKWRYDAIYCSNKCARATAQREYRRRRGG